MATNAERAKAYRQRYPERVKASKKAYEKRNPEKVRVQKKATYQKWKNKNQEKIKSYNKEYYKNNPEAIKDKVKKWAAENPEKAREHSEKWKERHPMRYAYSTQRQKAKKRGIGWQFTFEKWMEWWGEDLHRRGTGADNLQMLRYNDEGPYHPSNCYKGTPGDNRLDDWCNRKQGNG